MSQETKKSLAPKISAVLKKYGLKGTLSVEHYSTLVLTISSGEINFIWNYNAVANACNEGKTVNDYNYRRECTDGTIDVNVYHMNSAFDGVALKCLEELRAIMYIGNHDNSDAMTDYFDVGWYVTIQIGRWNKPYIFTKEDKPEVGKVYALTGGSDDKCLSNGNTWGESVVKESISSLA